MIVLIVALVVPFAVLYHRRKTNDEYQRGFREGMSFGLKQKIAVPIKGSKDEAKGDSSGSGRDAPAGDRPEEIYSPEGLG